MKRLKVFYVIDDYDGPSGGTEKQLLMLLLGMRALGHDVRLFVLRDTTGFAQTLSDFPCPIECLEIHRMFSLASIRGMLSFRRRIQTERPDAIHAFFNDAAILTPLYCKSERVRVLTSRRDMGYWYTRINLPLLRLAGRRLDRIVCNCSAVADAVARRERIPLEKLAVIYNGLQLDERPSNPAPRGVRGAGLDEREIRICMLANLRPIKRIEDLIQAAARVHTRYPDSRFVVVGESPHPTYRLELEALVRQHSLEGAVRFLPFTTEPVSVLQQCHVGVLCSESEGLSNAILEYMAAGLPVVCSDVGGNGELVEDGRGGYLYPRGDVAALAEHLNHLCADAGERQRMGAVSLQRARSFTPQRMVDAYVDVYTR